MHVYIYTNLILFILIKTFKPITIKPADMRYTTILLNVTSLLRNMIGGIPNNIRNAT